RARWASPDSFTALFASLTRLRSRMRSSSLPGRRRSSGATTVATRSSSTSSRRSTTSRISHPLVLVRHQRLDGEQVAHRHHAEQVALGGHDRQAPHLVVEHPAGDLYLVLVRRGGEHL